MISRSYEKYVEIHDFLPLPSVFDSTPDPVREFIYSALDGMVLDSVLLRVRPDIKVLTNGVLCYLRELQERFIPVSVFDGKATAENLRAVRQAISCLRAGNGVALFPAGEVSHWNSQQRRITDGAWNSLAVRCAKHVQAVIVPVFFMGGNSLLFQVAGLLHPGLRTARLPGELLNKRGIEWKFESGLQYHLVSCPTTTGAQRLICGLVRTCWVIGTP